MRRALINDSPFVTPRRLPRERYAEMGRKGARAKVFNRRMVELTKAPSLRTVIDRSDLRRSRAAAYATALVELHAARDFAEAAHWSRDAAAIRRGLRWVAAANVVADSCYDALIAAD